MPIYEYYCKTCDKKFETLIRGNETAECPDCGTHEVRKMMSACGFIRKGEGRQTVSASAGSGCGSCASSSCASCGI